MTKVTALLTESTPIPPAFMWKMLDGAAAEQSDEEDYAYDIFYSYRIVGDEMKIAPMVSGKLNIAVTLTYGDIVEDGFWVVDDGTLADAYDDNGTPSIPGDDSGLYELDELDVRVSDVSGDTLELAGNYFTLTEDTMVYTVDDDGVVDLGEAGDIDDGDTVLAVCEEDGNLMYVFVLAGAYPSVE